jgi:hypothetical protein
MIGDFMYLQGNDCIKHLIAFSTIIFLDDTLYLFGDLAIVIYLSFKSLLLLVDRLWFDYSFLFVAVSVRNIGLDHFYIHIGCIVLYDEGYKNVVHFMKVVYLQFLLYLKLLILLN